MAKENSHLGYSRRLDDSTSSDSDGREYSSHHNDASDTNPHQHTDNTGSPSYYARSSYEKRYNQPWPFAHARGRSTEDFTEEVTSFSSLVPSSNTSEQIEDPQKVLPSEEGRRGSPAPGDPLVQADDPTDADIMNPEERVILMGLKRSETAPQLRSLWGNSYSRKGSLSTTSDRPSRLDPHIYQSYAAGILHSSGRSEKFLKLQRNFIVLGRVSELYQHVNRALNSGKSPPEFQKKQAYSELEQKETSEEMSELRSHLEEAQKKKEFFSSASDAKFYWRPDKDRELQRSAGVAERLQKYQQAIKMAEEPTHHLLENSSNSMKRSVSFGDIYSRYDDRFTKTPSVKPFDELLSTQHTHKTVTGSTEKQSEPKPHVPTSELSDTDKVSPTTELSLLRRTCVTPGQVLPTSTPVISQYHQQLSSPSSNDTFTYFRNSKSSSGVQLEISCTQPHEYTSVDTFRDHEDDQLLASSLETLPSYQDAKQRSNSAHYTSHPSSQMSIQAAQYLPRHNARQEQTTLSTHISMSTVSTSPYEIEVPDFISQKTTQDDADGLHIRSVSAPYAAASLQMALAGGALQRTNSSKDTFFGAEYHVQDHQPAVGTPTQFLQPQVAASSTHVANDKVGSEKADKQESESNHSTREYSDSQPGASCDIKDRKMGNLEHGHVLPVGNKKSTTKHSTSVHQAKEDGSAEEVYCRTRSRSKDVFTKHLESTSARKSPQKESRATDLSKKEQHIPSFTATEKLSHSRRPRLLSEHAEPNGSLANPSNTHASNRNTSQYKDLLARARRERLARKGYIHSYVNDPEPVHFQPYTPVINTDSRLYNAYPFEFGSSSELQKSADTESMASSVDRMLQEYRSHVPTSPQLEDPFSPTFGDTDERLDDEAGSLLYQDIKKTIPKLSTGNKSSKIPLTRPEKHIEANSGSFKARTISHPTSTATLIPNNEDSDDSYSIIGNLSYSVSWAKSMSDVVQKEDEDVARKRFTDGTLRAHQEGPTIYNADKLSKTSSEKLQQPKTNVGFNSFKVTDLRGLAENNEFSMNKLSRMTLPQSPAVDKSAKSVTGIWSVQSQVDRHVSSNHEALLPPKPLPRKHTGSSLSASENFQFEPQTRGARGLDLKEIDFETTRINTKTASPARHRHSKTQPMANVETAKAVRGSENHTVAIPAVSIEALESAPEEGVSNSDRTPLGKWEDISEISNQQEVDSSPSPTLSSDGSTGTFIVNHSDDEARFSMSGGTVEPTRDDFHSRNASHSNHQFPTAAHHVPISKNVANDSNVPEIRQHNTGHRSVSFYPGTQIDGFYQTEIYQHYQKPVQQLTNSPASIKSSTPLTRYCQQSTKASVMQLKSVFEQKAKSSATSLSRAKSAPDLSGQLYPKDGYRHTSVEVGVKVTASRNLPEMQHRLHGVHVKAYSRKDTPSSLAADVQTVRPYADSHFKSESSLPKAVSEETGKLLSWPSLPHVATSTRYDPYIPPDDIYKEVESFKEGRKLDIPRKKSHSPSSVGRMTLEYFDHIAAEWQTGIVNRRSRDSENVSHYSGNGQPPANGEGTEYTHLKVRAEPFVKSSYKHHHTDDMKLRQEESSVSNSNRKEESSHRSVISLAKHQDQKVSPNYRETLSSSQGTDADTVHAVSYQHSHWGASSVISSDVPHKHLTLSDSVLSADIPQKHGPASNNVTGKNTLNIGSITTQRTANSSDRSLDIGLSDHRNSVDLAADHLQDARTRASKGVPTNIILLEKPREIVKPMPRSGISVDLTSAKRKSVPGRSQITSDWVQEQEREEQQPPAIPPPPSSASMNSFAVSASLSASSPSLYSPPDSNYPTLKRQPAPAEGLSTLPRTHQARDQAYRDPRKETLPSQPMKENIQPARYTQVSQGRDAEIRPHVPPLPPRFAVLNFPASDERVDSQQSPRASRQQGRSSEHQNSLYASSPALFDSSRGDHQTSPTAPPGISRGLVGSYDQLYGTRSPPQHGRNDSQPISNRPQGNFQGLYGSNPKVIQKTQLFESPSPYRGPQTHIPTRDSHDGPTTAPIPPQRHSSNSFGGGSGGVLDSWRDRNRATAAQQLGVKSPPSGHRVSPK
ncbi:unnamed protein product, partial [Candidula unifasciata]